MLNRIIFQFIFILSFPVLSFSQCPARNFNLPSNACVGDTIEASLETGNFANYQLDLAPGDLLTTPTATNFTSIQGLMAYPRTISIVKDGSNWFGFIGDNSASTIYRLSFGSSLNNTPNFDTLDFTTTGSNPGSSNCKLRFRKEGGQWYAAQVTGQNRLHIFGFGSSLANNNIVATTHVNPLGLFNNARDMVIVERNDSVFGLVINGSSNNISVLRFGNSISNTPISGYNETVISDSSLLSGSTCIDAAKHCNQWYVFVASPATDNVVRVNIGANFNGGASANLLLSNGDIPNPQSIKLVQEGGRFMGFVKSNSGTGISRLDFDTNLVTTPQVSTYSNFGGLTNGNLAFSLDVVNDSSEWFLFVTNAQNNQEKIIRLAYPDSSVNNSWTDSSSISFVVGETNQIKVSATVIDSNGNISVGIDSIAIFPSANLSFTNTGSCDNKATLFSNETESQDSVVSWKWHFGTGDSSILESPNYLFPDSSIYNVELSAITINGCISNLSEPIEIFKAPLSLFTVDTACTGAPISINDSSNAFTNIITEWNWITSLDTLLTALPNISFDSTGINEITLIISSDVGCSDTSSTSVFVKPSPTAQFDIGTSCFGDSTDFINLSVFPEGGFTNAWSFGDGGNSIDSNPLHLYNAIGSYYATLMLTGSNGCDDSATVEVVVSTPPVVDFETVQPVICDRSEINFQDLSTVSSGTIIGWNWYFGDGTEDSIQNPIKVYADSGNYQIVLEAFSGTKCSKTDTGTYTVYPLPSVALGFDATCEKQVTILNDDSVSIMGDSIDNWNINDSIFFSTKTAEISFEDEGQYSVSFSVESVVGCEQSLDTQIHILAAPITEISVPSGPYCTDINIPLQATTNVDVSDSISAYNWSFTFDTAVIDSSPETDFYPFSSFTGTHSITLQIESKLGCIASDSLGVLIAESPKMEVFYNSPCVRDTVSFVDNYDGSNYSYLWDFGDGFTSTSPDPNHVYSTSDTFYVKATITDVISGCYDLDTNAIVINPTPKPEYVSGPLCLNTPVKFEDNTNLKQDSVIKAQWMFIGHDTSNLLSPIIDYDIDNDLVLIYQIETERGCRGTETSILQFKTPISSSFNLEPSFGAAPLTVALLSSHIDSNTTFLVNDSDTLPGDSASFQLNGIYDITMVGQDENGCVYKSNKSLLVADPEVDLQIVNLELIESGENVSFKLLVRNNGNREVSDLSIRIDLNQNESFIESYSGIVEPDELVMIDLIGQLRPKSGETSIGCATLIFDLTNLDLTPENNQTCVSSLSGNQAFIPYPNPVSTQLIIPVLTPDLSADFEISVFSPSGRIIRTKTGKTSKGYNQLDIEMEDLPTGAYLVTLQLGDSNFDFTIIKR